MASLAARLAPLGAARIYLYAKHVDMRKSFDAGTFERPRSADDGASLEIDATDLTLLLAGVELGSVKRRPRYRHASAVGSPQLAGN